MVNAAIGFPSSRTEAVPNATIPRGYDDENVLRVHARARVKEAIEPPFEDSREARRTAGALTTPTPYGESACPALRPGQGT